MAIWDDIMQKLEEVGQDITSLDVVTLTGNLDLTAEVSGGGLDEMVRNLKDRVKTQANLQMVAYTHVDLDGDVVSFVREGASNEDELMKAHSALVKSSTESRLHLVRFLKDLF